MKINHFASKDIKVSATFGVEAIMTELFVGFFAGFFAYIGYSSNLLLLFGLCLLVTLACVLSVGFALREHLQHKKYLQAKQAELDRHSETLE